MLFYNSLNIKSNYSEKKLSKRLELKEKLQKVLKLFKTS